MKKQRKTTKAIISEMRNKTAKKSACALIIKVFTKEKKIVRYDFVQNFTRGRENDQPAGSSERTLEIKSSLCRSPSSGLPSQKHELRGPMTADCSRGPIAFGRSSPSGPPIAVALLIV